MMQSDLFRQFPQSARSDKDEILALLERYRADYLARARAVARALGQGGHPVTVDDVRHYCPPPANVDPRVMGAIFNRSDWMPVEVVNSSRRTCHNRPIRQFVLRGAV